MISKRVSLLYKMPIQERIDPNSKTETLRIIDPNDTAYLISKAREKKKLELGELAVIHVASVPKNICELEEFLVRTPEGQWKKYSSREGSYVLMSQEELARISDPRHYALQGPVNMQENSLATQQDGSKDYFLFRKNIT